ncbi:Pleiotropic regulatory protein [Candidatus Nitrospira nitrosa]|uniref:Pleiotropic regulatory protein n=1 Tax=Candidatus Nitrospira nitrosa TaxID=1742972 RepID=A0A0S4LI40_9BACT|nr:DegT/DnrJ/EryC1/StrS family aminotransferase [Candidatus Nitrospira nitrosa]CUS36585.1 Pleiotropic regulatory protein [Candidatus Nitrospira nitrosa]
MSNENIPFLDLVSVHRQLQDELVDVLKTALKSAGFIGGPMVQGFEEEFARFCEARFCVGLGSGTDALRFALIAAGVKSGDIVITVPNTFIATTEAISQAGARPDFVDVDSKTYTMDPEQLREYLERKCRWNPKTRQVSHNATGRPITAIVPVHLYGQMADMDPILELATQYNLKVVEDACQAQGAEYFSQKENRWCKAGSMGHAAAFSFYPGKNLGACGEAGAMTTNDEQLTHTCRLLRDHGQSKKYFHDIEGYNGRLDAIQAGFLQVKLKHLATWNEQRRQAAERYAKLFAGAEGLVTLPHQPSWARSVYHLYVVQVDDRARLQQNLNDVGIGTGIHYPVALHLTKAYKELGFRVGDFPVTERSVGHILSLPMFPGLTTIQQDRVVSEVLRALSVEASSAN